MAAIFLAKRGTLNMHRATSLHINHSSSAQSITDRIITITTSRYFSSNRNNGGEKSKQEGMGTTTDGKAPNVTMSHASDSAKDGLKRAIDVANEESGDASKAKSDTKNEENVAVGEDGTVKGQNQSSG